MAKKSGCMGFNILNLALAAGLLVLIFSSAFYGSTKPAREGLTNNKEFVLVHMNGCGHCKTLMPEWNAAAKENKSGIPMRAVEMNEDDGPELCDKHNISGFPTMILLENGKKISDYNGERDKSGLLAFLEGK